jgi:hypothetical protein
MPTLGQRLGGKPGLPRELGFLTQGTDTMEQWRLASTPALDQSGKVLKIPRLRVHHEASLRNRQIEAFGQRQRTLKNSRSYLTVEQRGANNLLETATGHHYSYLNESNKPGSLLGKVPERTPTITLASNQNFPTSRPPGRTVPGPPYGIDGSAAKATPPPAMASRNPQAIPRKRAVVKFWAINKFNRDMTSLLQCVL